MKAGEIYSKTMPFVWAKLLLGLANAVAAIVLFAILMGIASVMNSGSAAFILFLVWLAATGMVRFVLLHYFGYLVKAGHVAVITEAVVSGSVPENQIEYGKQRVKDRFATANVYFLLDKLVSGAVKQIQKGVSKVGDLLGFIPGIHYVVGIAQFFIEIFLGYVDECCLGYTFYKEDQSAFKSAADGVVIYAQNWKKLLANAAKTMVAVIALLAVVVLIFVGILSAAFRGFNLGFLGGLVSLLIAFMIALAIKSAFLDSYILVKMLSAYMQDAPDTEITFDLYEKLSGLSGKFKELFQRGQQEPQPTASTTI
ncbi:MAG: hypothetical protein LBU58_04750 [Clostridiales bacterium]|jgi:uncharacterized membrane protein|nr:hypothetical protein [Clostridiales bacterium]